MVYNAIPVSVPAVRIIHIQRSGSFQAPWHYTNDIYNLILATYYSCSGRYQDIRSILADSHHYTCAGEATISAAIWQLQSWPKYIPTNRLRNIVYSDMNDRHLSTESPEGKMLTLRDGCTNDLAPPGWTLDILPPSIANRKLNNVTKAGPNSAWSQDSGVPTILSLSSFGSLSSVSKSFLSRTTRQESLFPESGY